MDKLHNIYICFPQGKHKCLTMSYDDGKSFDRPLVGLLNETGIKGTFHLNGGMLEYDTYEERIGFEEIRELYQGHEVSGHTFTHPTIERCPLEQVVQQIIEDRKILEEACGYPVRGFSYPNGSYSEEIIRLLPACGIEYARIVGDSLSFGMPGNFLEWKPTCHQNHPELMELAKRFADLSKSQHLNLMYIWGHSYELEEEDCWIKLQEFCRFIGGREDIWYASNIEIVDYMNAARNLKYTAKGDKVYNPGAMTVWIEVDKRIIKVAGGELTDIF